MSASYDGFWKICDDNGVCHCDWRLTVYGCEEEKHMVPFYIALAAFSGLVGTMGKCPSATTITAVAVVNIDPCSSFSCHSWLLSHHSLESNCIRLSYWLSKAKAD